MKVITYLEEAIENIGYDSLGEWCISDISKYSREKNLFEYQVTAIRNAIKVLSSYYAPANTDKKAIFNLCLSAGMDAHRFDIPQFNGNKCNEQYSLLKGSYKTTSFQGKSIIEAYNFFNRMCFWMATASGKTLILIKMIEILDTLVRKGLVPKNNFMVLLPSEKIQNQFAAAVEEYNVGKERKIHLTSLKNYEDEENSFTAIVLNEINVYTYRSDLLSDQEKSKKVDTVIYDNGGRWFIFMDEAHKGDREDSLRQNYITRMSRNGFLFNFSATFTDDIDYATTCYNFNLDKFIRAKYGKNVYLSESKYQFKRKADDFSEKDKQLQVLKSLITLTLVRMSRQGSYYHNPLMVTLVNEVNTVDSDTDLFFAELAKIAKGQIDEELFETAKIELYDEFIKNQKFQFGDEHLHLEDGILQKALSNITIKDIWKYAYNADSAGTIEVVEGEKGKEFALKLKTADLPFALFRIGDASQYIREKLSGDYLIVKAYEERHYFDDLNNAGSPFTMLIGSRMFYEGWDSNRPNIMNFINIGTGDAKKFILQSLGRGVRIEPTANNRQRLPVTDSNKNQLLETLFVFATNRNAVQTILETMNTQKADEHTIELIRSTNMFDLLIPQYKETALVDRVARFRISKNAFERLKVYLGSLSDELILLNTSATKDILSKLRNGIKNFNQLFREDNKFDYQNMPSLLNKLIAHLTVKEKDVSGFKKLEDEILHFKHIKITKEKWDQIGDEIDSFIALPETGSGEDQSELFALQQRGEISLDEFLSRMQATKPKDKAIIGDLELRKLAQHYYMPLIMSQHSKLDYMKHIIDVPSEVSFVENLLAFVKNNKVEWDWMFSKIDQTIDSHTIAMPYFSYVDNSYHEFYPDFIFWLKKGKEYKIIFIDPKGTEHASYLSKIDGFNKLFRERDNSNKPKEFSFGGYSITFDLKLAYLDDGTIPDRYKDYWISTNEFEWLN